MAVVAREAGWLIQDDEVPAMFESSIHIGSSTSAGVTLNQPWSGEKLLNSLTLSV